MQIGQFWINKKLNSVKEKCYKTLDKINNLIK